MHSKAEQAPLTVWDSPAEPSAGDGTVYRWSGYAQTDLSRSLLGYIEGHGERLRRKYLAWIHELGESRGTGRRLTDQLALGDGLSYWWMTLLVEKSPWKSPSISDAMRLLALEEIILESRPARIQLVSADSRLHEVLRDLCRKLAIAYEWRRPERTPVQHLSFMQLYRKLPARLQALISLSRYLRGRWPLRSAARSGWFGGAQTVFFCSYFIHLDAASAKEGRFYSRQWEELPQLLQAAGYCTNWMQHYLPSGTVPDTRTATDWVRHFNQQQPRNSFHTFLDSYLTAGVALRVLTGWLRLNWLHWRLRAVRFAFTPPASNLSLWPIMRSDWHRSLCGTVAIENMLWLELFAAALRDLPQQRKGFYICEGQAWERAFIHAWRKHGHGQLIGVAHSTVRFWDLRYFTDSETVRASGPNALPLPDLTAVNGRAALEAYLRVDYPKERLAECEAVRFGYLNDLEAAPARRKSPGEPLSVLVLGDVAATSTIKLLRLLEAAAQRMPGPRNFTFKPHPNYMVAAGSYASLRLRVVTSPLAQIIRDFDIAYCSSSTSAAVDAYLAGLPVVVMLDGTELNFSPLRARPGVCFVSTPEELAAALQSTADSSPVNRDRTELLNLDPELPRWKRLLGLPSTVERCNDLPA